ncbi:MAG: hypothetical protein KatS3mg067_0408 [Thermosynechococcus sp.]|nr:MAG: hypothetical protein KatS3mg067_0408 [Thermosynechococcus sp.]
MPSIGFSSGPDKVDYLVVETTGLADPLPVALTFLGTDLRDLTRSGLHYYGGGCGEL